MNKDKRQTNLTLASPARYRIRVQGHVYSDWDDRLGEMTITTDTAKPPGVTVLVGRVADQAALSGILNTLYDLHLPLLSVEHLPENQVRRTNTGWILFSHPFQDDPILFGPQGPSA